MSSRTIPAILFQEENKLLFTIFATFRQKQTQPLVRFLLFIGLLAISSYLLKTDPATNLWSLGYLWQTTDHSLAFLLPDSTTTTPPTNHLNGLIWQARTAAAHGDNWQAEQLLAPAIAQGNRDALRLQAEILNQQGDYINAYKLWAQLEDIDALLQAGLKSSQTGKLAEALTAYRTAYLIAPERTVLPLAHFLWSANEQADAAEQLLADALRTYQVSRYGYDWLRELGAVYQSQKEWNKAATVYEQIIAAAPDRIQERIALGWVYYKRGDGAAIALAQFEQAIAVAPQTGAGYYAIGSLLTQEKRYAEADPWYQQAIERDPAQQSWYLGRAGALQQLGELSQALAVYAIVQQRFPGYAQGYYQAAWAYRQAEDREQAVAAIGQALQLMDGSDINQRQTQVSYYVRAGQIYEWAGQLQKAVAAYERAEQLDPLRQDIQDGLQRLR